MENIEDRKQFLVLAHSKRKHRAEVSSIVVILHCQQCVFFYSAVVMLLDCQ